SFLVLTRPPARPPLFPYTTLFRSVARDYHPYLVFTHGIAVNAGFQPFDVIECQVEIERNTEADKVCKGILAFQLSHLPHALETMPKKGGERELVERLLCEAPHRPAADRHFAQRDVLGKRAGFGEPLSVRERELFRNRMFIKILADHLPANLGIRVDVGVVVRARPEVIVQSWIPPAPLPVLDLREELLVFGRISQEPKLAEAVPRCG